MKYSESTAEKATQDICLFLIISTIQFQKMNNVERIIKEKYSVNNQSYPTEPQTLQSSCELDLDLKVFPFLYSFYIYLNITTNIYDYDHNRPAQMFLLLFFFVQK